MKNDKPKAKEIKQSEVQALRQKVKDAKTIAFVDYHGLTVNQASNLREKIKESGGELLVAKNTMLKRALASQNFPKADDKLLGPTAVVFSYSDEVAPIKSVSEIAKTLGGIPKFKFGYFGQNLLDAKGVEALSKIPGREVLQGQVVGIISAPIRNFVGVLNANLRNLVIVLDQISKKKI